jgi:hypothetical protein
MLKHFVMRRKIAISTCFITKICCQIREKQAGSGGARHHGQLLRQAARPGARGGTQVAILIKFCMGGALGIGLYPEGLPQADSIFHRRVA